MLADAHGAIQANAAIERYAGIEGRNLIKSVLKDYPGRVALLSSFGAESSVLLHMASEVDPHVPVIFLDTLKLFPETIAYRDKLVSELGLTNLLIAKPDEADLAQFDPQGDLHGSNTDFCCYVRKTVPMDEVLKDFDVIISGRKRFHGSARSDLQFVNLQDGKLKIEPLAGFSALDLQTYMQQHHLPSHPLKLAGYRSIGCVPCTAVGGNDEDPRAGRWQGTNKTECGIHFSANGQVIRTVTRQAALT
ncbi:MAG: phosphoadenylyl-sulfate reductase [Proteobacteria bacterium]|nr:phosphoadenylyl-sulfate reductase [Pseudomonadota bacterium]